jgi:hypothetical protein
MYEAKAAVDWPNPKRIGRWWIAPRALRAVDERKNFGVVIKLLAGPEHQWMID